MHICSLVLIEEEFRGARQMLRTLEARKTLYEILGKFS